MCGDMIDAATSWESLTSLNFVGFNQLAIGVFDLVANINKAHARLDNGLSILSYLSVTFGTLSQCLVIVSEESLALSELSPSCALSVLVSICVFKDLIHWVFSIGELLTDGDSRRVCLLVGVFSFSGPVSKHTNV